MRVTRKKVKGNRNEMNSQAQALAPIAIFAQKQEARGCGDEIVKNRKEGRERSSEMREIRGTHTNTEWPQQKYLVQQQGVLMGVQHRSNQTLT